MTKAQRDTHLHAWPGLRLAAAGLLFILLVPARAVHGRDPAGQHKSLPTGKLEGTVLGLDGKPAVKARVIAQSSDGRNPRSAKTDGQGHFQLTCTAGPVDVRARAGENWSDWMHNIRVRANETTSVTIQIKQQPDSGAGKSGASSPPRH